MRTCCGRTPEQLQIAVQEQLEKFWPALQAGGYAGQAEIKATLGAITPEVSQVVFPEYGVLGTPHETGITYASGQATPCFQWFARPKYEQTCELIRDKPQFPILLTTQRLIEHLGA